MSTISTEERRDVARRLRKAIGLTEFAEVLGFNWTDDSDWAWKDVSNLVADLIEPGEPKVRCVAEVKIDGERLGELVHDAAVELTGIDRDALLALAEDVEESAAMATAMDASRGSKLLAGLLLDIARRIRKACGVVDDGS